MRSPLEKTPKERGLPSDGTRKSRIVLAAFVPESPAHRCKLQGFCDYAAKAGWNVETVFNIGALGQSITSLDELDIYDGFVIDFWPLYHIIDPLRLQRPVVSVDRSFGDDCGIDTVMCDSRAVGVTAAQELLKRDPASIAFVAPALDWNFFETRKESFISAVEAAGRDVLVWSIGDKDDRLAERQRLAAWLRSLPKPCAVFAPNDIVAVAVFSAARLASLRMPQDVAILGVDNDELICGSCLPSLSSVMVDFENAGRIAARLLDARMADVDAGRSRGPDRHETYGVLGIASRGSTRVVHQDEHPYLQHGLEFITRNACRGISVADVARAMFLSRRAAEYAFAASGRTIHGAILDARLDRVRKLLLATSAPLEAIATSCGFSSAEYANPLFKARFGATMGAFRNKARKER
jgi:LacI family transcriptional regulator